MTLKYSHLFSPITIGPLALSHRVVMAPLTRSRSEQPGDIPGALMIQYYGQRASDGGLIVSEATTISIAGRGWFGAPGLYSDEQVAGWKKVTEVVHAKGGRMFFATVAYRPRLTHRQYERRDSLGAFRSCLPGDRFHTERLAPDVTTSGTGHRRNSRCNRGVSTGRRARESRGL